MEQMKTFGGIFWDTLFILLRDNDDDFIINFVNRLPCEICKKEFFRISKKYNMNCKKEECYEVLWAIRCKIDKKYRDSKTKEKLNEYLKYLKIVN